jgi:hypothetical protein
MLPKIHKANNPGRPIVSACAGTTEKISEFIDLYIKALAQSVDSYIKDTNDFLWKLHNHTNKHNISNHRCCCTLYVYPT